MRPSGFDCEGGAATDFALAKIYASTIAISDAAINAFLKYAEIEARALLEKNWHCVEAVARALQERQTLTGAEIDAVIVEAEALREHEAELMCRQAMAKAAMNAVKLGDGICR